MSKKTSASLAFLCAGMLHSSTASSEEQLTKKLHPMQYQAAMGAGYNVTQKEPIGTLEASMTHVPLVTEYHPVFGSPSIDLGVKSQMFLDQPDMDAVTLLINSRLHFLSHYLFEEGLYLETGPATRIFGHHNSKYAGYGGSYLQAGHYRGIMSISAYMEIMGNNLNLINCFGMDSTFKVHEDVYVGISADTITPALEKDLYFPGYVQISPKVTLFQHFLLQSSITLNGLSTKQEINNTDPRTDFTFTFSLGYTGEKDIDSKTVFRK